MNFLAALEQLRKPLVLSFGFILIGIIGFIDFLTGYEFGFSIFYVLPIALITWRMGQHSGLAASLASSLVWLAADLASGHHYSQPFIPFWNCLIRLAFFVIITLLLAALRKATDRESELARRDYLTGATSARFFYDLAQMEIDRLQRYGRPFTLAYLDLDNFKRMNDQFGHNLGDEVLQVVVHAAEKYMRKTDIIARLGGDEFALLLPETGQETVQATLCKLQAGLLEAMRQNNWPITFSIGALTCNAAPATAMELVRLADGLMYSAKREGKNALKYASFPAG